MITRRFVVHGLVQGVGFRWFAARQAAKLSVLGFARNLSDGSVEVVGQGSESALQSLAEALARGPSMAHVSSVDSDIPHDIESFKSFDIR